MGEAVEIRRVWYDSQVLFNELPWAHMPSQPPLFPLLLPTSLQMGSHFYGLIS